MKLWRWGLVAAMAVAGVVGGAVPAKSECLVVTVELHWWHADPDTYPLGERDKCVTDTPWNQGQPVGIGWDFHDGDPLVPGTPQGVYVEVMLTGP